MTFKHVLIGVHTVPLVEFRNKLAQTAKRMHGMFDHVIEVQGTGLHEPVLSAAAKNGRSASYFSTDGKITEPELIEAIKDSLVVLVGDDFSETNFECFKSVIKAGAASVHIPMDHIKPDQPFGFGKWVGRYGTELYLLNRANNQNHDLDSGQWGLARRMGELVELAGTIGIFEAFPNGLVEVGIDMDTLRYLVKKRDMTVFHSTFDEMMPLQQWERDSSSI